MPNTVNPQVTDAVTQANVEVVGEAPAMAMGNVYQTLSHSLSLLYTNSVAAQQNLAITAQAATTQGIMQIYSVDTTADAIAISALTKGTGANAKSIEAAEGKATPAKPTQRAKPAASQAKGGKSAGQKKT